MACQRAFALTVLLLAASATGTTFQQAVVFTHADFASFAGARALVTGDFNRDGWTDLAHANAGRNSVTLLLNQGRSASSFVRADDVPVGAGPFDMTSGDFNRDGWLDLAVTHGSASSIAILSGRPSGGFTRTDIAVPAGPRGIAATDFNKDGRLDLIVTGWDANAIRILLGNASGGFDNGALIPSVGVRPQGVAALDVNRDGHLDLVVAHESGNGLGLLTGNAGTIVQSRSIPGLANLNVLAVGDFNRDGWADIAAASSSGSRVAVYLGGSAGPSFHRAYATGASPRGIVVKDLNSDGFLDLVTANRDGDSVSVLLGDADAPGAFEPAQTFAADAGSRAVVADDFDRDGRIDLATANQDAATASVLWNGTVFDTAAFSFSRFTFGPPTNESGSSKAIPADFNEDGKLDVVVRPDFFRFGIVVHVMLTDGPVVALPFERYQGTYFVDDLNRDGHIDVLLVEDSQGVAILWPYLGNGRGAFTRAPETRIPRRLEVTLGDLNADAVPDVVYSDSFPGGFFLQVLLGRGDGTFTTGGRVYTSVYTSGQTVVDQTRDGKMDVVAFVEGSLTVFRGDGAGNLTQASSSPLSNRVLQVLKLGDLNHDGLLDAVSFDQQRFFVSLGGPASFDTPHIIEAPVSGSSWTNLALADINLDGDLDIVTATGLILRGRGNGTFEPAERFDWDAPYINIADFTRDGLPDVVIPDVGSAFQVIANERNSVNHDPTVNAGPDQTFTWTQLRDDFGPEVVAIGDDPDVHKLTYEWSNESGTVIGRDRFLSIQNLAHGSYVFTITAFDGRGGRATDSLRITIVPTTEIVVWAASGFYSGTFSLMPDPSAANGGRGYDLNLGRPKVTTPVPVAGDRILLGFIADPTQTYKLWVRLKADGNHWSNDSVWVQFTNSVNEQGVAAYRVGTTSGLAINLEECLDCGVSGWGWADDGWGAPNVNGVKIRFPTGGHQNLVVQTREDGVSIDQVVLSSSRYATTRPGPAKNDTTILPFTFWQEQ